MKGNDTIKTEIILEWLRNREETDDDKFMEYLRRIGRLYNELTGENET